MKNRWRLKGDKGQSLVELALTLPLLLLMFAGLVEIGAASEEAPGTPSTLAAERIL